MKRVANKSGKENERNPEDLQEQGLRILAHIIAKAYICRIRAEKEVTGKS
jgi:hypothetical protein